MGVLNILCSISTLGIYAVADGSSLRMVQSPIRLTAVKGTNVSMNCSYTLFDPKAILDVSWSRRNQNRSFEVTADNREVVIYSKPSAAELHLLNVDFQDTGIYQCSARDWKHKISSGSGTELTVHVPPTPVKITHQSHSTLLCATAGFFPKEINITWYENYTEITTEFNTTIERNKEGLYQISSYLSPVQNAVMYTCEISHVSLYVPANDSYMFLDQATSDSILQKVAGCAVAGLLLLVLVIVVILCKLNTIKGTKVTSVNSKDNSQFEEQRIQQGEMKFPSYALLNFREYKRSRKHRNKEDQTLYAMIKEETEVNPTYESLDMTNLPKQQQGNRLKT